MVTPFTAPSFDSEKSQSRAFKRGAAAILLLGMVFAFAAYATRHFGMWRLDTQTLWHDGAAIIAVAIFAATYLVIAVGKLPGYHLDRAGAALLGASLMVGLGVVSLDQAYRAIDFDTIALLLGMMIVVANLRLSGFFRLVNNFVVTRAHHPLVLLASFVLVAGSLSAFLERATATMKRAIRRQRHSLRHFCRVYDFAFLIDRCHVQHCINAGRFAGFSEVEPWLPIADDADMFNLANERDDPSSLFSLYLKLIRLRRTHRALQLGAYRAVEASGDVMLYGREADNDRIFVALNMGSSRCTVRSARLRGEVLLSTDGTRDSEPIRDTIELRADEGLIVGVSPDADIPAAVEIS